MSANFANTEKANVPKSQRLADYHYVMQQKNRPFQSTILVASLLYIVWNFLLQYYWVLERFENTKRQSVKTLNREVTSLPRTSSPSSSLRNSACSSRPSITKYTTLVSIPTQAPADEYPTSWRPACCYVHPCTVKTRFTADCGSITLARCRLTVSTWKACRREFRKSSKGVSETNISTNEDTVSKCILKQKYRWRSQWIIL